eukprot:Polyplicarium_translucidae@DN2395_c0_g1_i1.p1
MSDLAQKVLEHSVEEFLDLEEKQIFSQTEIKEIAAKRKRHEFQIVGQMRCVGDFLDYIESEINLEVERAERSWRLGWRDDSVSDRSLVKRLHFIFLRALRAVPEDRTLWLQYVDFCLQSRSARAVEASTLKALQLHPMHADFWIIAADRQLQLGAIVAARNLLLRGIRANDKSVELWKELLRLEFYGLLEVSTAKAAKSEEGEVAPQPPSASAATVVFRSGISALEAAEGDLLVFAALKLLFAAKRRLSQESRAPPDVLDGFADATKAMIETRTLEQPFFFALQTVLAALQQGDCVETSRKSKASSGFVNGLGECDEFRCLAVFQMIRTALEDGNLCSTVDEERSTFMTIDTTGDDELQNLGTRERGSDPQQLSPAGEDTETDEALDALLAASPRFAKVATRESGALKLCGLKFTASQIAESCDVPTLGDLFTSQADVRVAMRGYLLGTTTETVASSTTAMLNFLRDSEFRKKGPRVGPCLAQVISSIVYDNASPSTQCARESLRSAVREVSQTENGYLSVALDIWRRAEGNILDEMGAFVECSRKGGAPQWSAAESRNFYLVANRLLPTTERAAADSDGSDSGESSDDERRPRCAKLRSRWSSGGALYDDLLLVSGSPDALTRARFHSLEATGSKIREAAMFRECQRIQGRSFGPALSPQTRFVVRLVAARLALAEVVGVIASDSGDCTDARCRMPEAVGVAKECFDLLTKVAVESQTKSRKLIEECWALYFDATRCVEELQMTHACLRRRNNTFPTGPDIAWRGARSLDFADGFNAKLALRSRSSWDMLADALRSQ